MTSAVDPFEGLPAHMLQSIPLTVDVVVEYPPRLTTVVVGERKIMLDAPPTKESHTVRLERGGRPLTVADRRGWLPGEAEGWRPSIVNPCISREEIIVVEAEECE